MKNKLKGIIPIFILIYCLIVIPIIFYKYNIYLNKPDGYMWGQTRAYLVDSGKYNNEPIVFRPDWLKNYASDYGRFKNINIEKTAKNYSVFWLISFKNSILPKKCQVISSIDIGNLRIAKLKVIDNQEK